MGIKFYHHVQADSNLLGPDDDPFAVDSRPAFVPSSKEINKSIDIDLRETDTIWMFILPGTCKEIEGDEDVQRTKKRKGVVVCCYTRRHIVWSRCSYKNFQLIGKFIP